MPRPFYFEQSAEIDRNLDGNQNDSRSTSCSVRLFD